MRYNALQFKETWKQTFPIKILNPSLHNFILNKTHTEHYTSQNLVSLLKKKKKKKRNTEKSRLNSTGGLQKVPEEYGLICHIKCNFTLSFNYYSQKETN